MGKYDSFISNTFNEMTIPSERSRAVIQTENFLLSLCDPTQTPGISKEIRSQARSLLRHYPSKYDLNVIADSWSSAFSQCPFDKIE